MKWFVIWGICVILSMGLVVATMNQDKHEPQTMGANPYRSFGHLEPENAGLINHTGPPRIAACTIYEKAIVCDGAKLKSEKHLSIQ